MKSVTFFLFIFLTTLFLSNESKSQTIDINPSKQGGDYTRETNHSSEIRKKETRRINYSDEEDFNYYNKYITINNQHNIVDKNIDILDSSKFLLNQIPNSAKDNIPQVPANHPQIDIYNQDNKVEKEKPQVTKLEKKEMSPVAKSVDYTQTKDIYLSISLGYGVINNAESSAYEQNLSSVTTQTQQIQKIYSVNKSYNGIPSLNIGMGFYYKKYFRYELASSFSSFSGNGASIVTDKTNAPTSNITVDSSYGNFNLYDIMFNGYVDIFKSSKISPFFGAGVGIGYLDSRNKYWKSKFTYPIYQGMIGVNYSLKSDQKISLFYKLKVISFPDNVGMGVAAEDKNGILINNRPLSDKSYFKIDNYLIHSINLGFSF